MEEMGLEEHESPGSQSDVLSTMGSHQKGCQLISWLKWVEVKTCGAHLRTSLEKSLPHLLVEFSNGMT